MRSGDVTSDLGRLEPASSVRPLEQDSPKRDADRKGRREPRDSRDSEDSGGENSTDETTRHQVDRLA